MAVSWRKIVEVRRCARAASFHVVSGAKLKFSLAPACWCFAHAKTKRFGIRSMYVVRFL